MARCSQTLSRKLQCPRYFLHRPNTHWSGALAEVAAPCFNGGPDVREPAANKPEQAFEFIGQTIYLQTGPARLAQMTDALVVPAAIEYNPLTQMHTLSLYEALSATDATPHEVTQQALNKIGPHIERAPQQQFYDLLGALQVPQSPATPSSN